MRDERYRRLLPAVEVVCVCIVAIVLGRVLRGTGFRRWQVTHFGFTYLSNGLFLFGLPLAAMVLSRRPIGDYGLTTRNLAYHARIGLKSYVILIPICVLLAMMPHFGTAYDKWPGSILLSIAVILGTGAAILWFRRDPGGVRSSIKLHGLVTVIALLTISLFIGWVLLPFSKKLGGVLYMFVFTGFLEEFLFRGYVQSRLNDAFSKPFTIGGVRFGPGLLIASVLFGLGHLLNTSPVAYPWALWATAFGFFFGFIREKTGAIVASGIAHGLFVVPIAIFSGS